MRLRSLLFVPGDSRRKFEKAQPAGADVLILDLEDSVAPSQKAEARAQVASLLHGGAAGAPPYFVRPNSLDSGLLLEDLAAVVRPGLGGLLLPKINGAAELERIGHYLDALEAKSAMPPESVRLAVVSTETPAAMFNLGGYTPAHVRLVGLTWGAEDLAAAVGATSNKDAEGHWTFPYQSARAQCLFAAAAAGVAPIDTLYADYKDVQGLAADCRAARRDGFTGRIAIHPDQVATINECFSPSPDDLAHARRVIDAFAAKPDAGAVGIDGQMYDIPHLTAARRTLAAAGASDHD